MHYAKSGVVLTSFYEFLGVFVVSLFAETVILFVALIAINFIVIKAFPVEPEDSVLLIDENGELINVQEEMREEALRRMQHEDL
jgi:hypothetical protein